MDPEESHIPRIPIGDWASSGIDWLRTNWSGFFDAIDAGITFLNDKLTYGFVAIQPLVLIAILALLAWALRSWKLAVGSVITFLLVLSMDMWEAMLQTMSLVLIATVIAVIIAVPVGILAATSRAASAVIRPILDFMQTMPAFVYLIPAVFFFHVGIVPGLVSTIVFAMPPGVRMTELGIRQVNGETVEAGESFGASTWQILKGIQLPLAIPNIMAGVNQVIMLALSMAVMAGLAGADGLGKKVTEAISTLNLSMGVEAGLGVVFLAIYLDRLTAAIGNPGDYKSSIVALIKKARKKRAKALAA
jgi:glycine betaine/proline transport system permease protein